MSEDKQSNGPVAALQQETDQWIRQVGVRYFNELTNMAILTEEVGEVARLIARQYGEQSFKPSDEGRELGDELADVLFVLICLANQTGTDLTEALAVAEQQGATLFVARARAALGQPA